VKSVAEKKTKLSVIPDKLYFKIGEVAEIVGVKPYVLRYWETEFPEIAPGKSASKQRLYKRKEVELILRIRDLLYRDKFTIDGARKQIKNLGKKVKQPEEGKQMGLQLSVPAPSSGFLEEIKVKLTELEKMIEALH